MRLQGVQRDLRGVTQSLELADELAHGTTQRSAADPSATDHDAPGQRPGTCRKRIRLRHEVSVAAVAASETRVVRHLDAQRECPH